jgi:hypothetical protein
VEAQHTRGSVPAKTACSLAPTSTSFQKRKLECSADKPTAKRRDYDGLLAAFDSAPGELSDENIHVVRQQLSLDVQSNKSTSSESSILCRKLGFVIIAPESDFLIPGLPMSTTSNPHALGALHKIILDSIYIILGRSKDMDRISNNLLVFDDVLEFTSSFGRQIWPSRGVQRPDFIDPGCKLDGRRSRHK